MLPLWEGFDEPFHYGYVQSLANAHGIPVLGRTTISDEIRESLTESPLPRLLQTSVPGSIAIEQWPALPASEKLQREKALAAIPARLRFEPSTFLNYEAQQAPLAYILLAPIDRLMWRVPLRTRILILRLILALVGTAAAFLACNLLCTALGIVDPFRFLMLACIFETQMFWATVAHVANDWLAVPVAIALCALLGLVSRRNRSNDALLMAAALTVGLLTKTYFLAFVPVFVGVVVYKRICSLLPSRVAALALLIPLVIAGPWYARNVLLYGNLSGLQEVGRGIGLGQAIAALPSINWFASATAFARWSLWTGNWSFVAFSRATLDTEVLLLLACLLFFAQKRKIGPAELWILLALASFALALVYYTCVAAADTHGRSSGPEPWYAQAVLPVIWALAFLALQRSGAIGRWMSALIALLTAWIAALTYFAKLIPFYGGFHGRSMIPAVAQWWCGDPQAALSGVTLAPAPLAFALLGIFALLLAIVTAVAIACLIGRTARSQVQPVHLLAGHTVAQITEKL